MSIVFHHLRIDNSIDTILDEVVNDVIIRDCIIIFALNKYKKVDFCNMVKDLDIPQDELYNGFQKTIAKLESKFL